jgi:hypothetical protein
MKAKQMIEQAYKAVLEAVMLPLAAFSRQAEAKAAQEQETPPVKRGRGRPKGSKNKPKPTVKGK